MTTIQIVALTTTFITVALWDFCIFLEQIEILPKNPAFALWSLVMWIALVTIGIKSFGVIGGIALLIFGMMGFGFVFRLIFGRLIQQMVTADYKTPIAFFTIGVIVSVALAIAC